MAVGAVGRVTVGAGSGITTTGAGTTNSNVFINAWVSWMKTIMSLSAMRSDARPVAPNHAVKANAWSWLRQWYRYITMVNRIHAAEMSVFFPSNHWTNSFMRVSLILVSDWEG